MGLVQRAMSALRHYTVFDVTMFKLCMIAFTLLIAKLWPPLLSLEWYWYGLVFLVSYFWLIRQMLTYSDKDR